MKVRACVSAAVLSVVLLGCGSNIGVVKQRFQNEFKCRDVVVDGIGGSTYVAKGCGAQATYSCADNGARWAPPGSRTVCVREYSQGQASTEPVAPGPIASPPPSVEPVSKVERIFDEKRQVHVVRGKFRTAAAGSEILLVGSPEHKLATVFVHASIGGAPNPASCNTLRMLINGKPFDGADVKITPKGDRTTSGFAAFEFELLKPLTREYAEFGVELCNQRLKLEDIHMRDLMKFMAIFSQMAGDAAAAAPPPPPDPAAVTDTGAAL